jgi:uncharacterized membrane protein SpoIIM required for sporulation/uncharacterized RDD family membrane protein YckC
MTQPISTATGAQRDSLDQTVQVETPEQVAFSYSIAGVGSRAAAALMDYMLCLAPGALLATFLMPLFARSENGEPRSELGLLLMAFLILAQFAALWSYYVIFEALFDGQTPGKRRMGLRVVQDGGYSVSFAASAVRNIARIIDMQPILFYVVGMVSVAFSRSGKRLGDHLAGTMVVEEKAVHTLPDTRRAPVSDDAPVIALLTEDEYALLERFVARRQTIDADRRRALSDQLLARFHQALGSTPGSGPAQLLELYERERAARARGAAGRSDTGARREQHALVAAGTSRWRGFAERLAHARKIGLGRLSEDDVREFVSEYREVATDLARLQTASRGRQVDAVFYLSRLVAGGHNLLYRRRQLAALAVWRYLTLSIPREVRRSWVVIGVAALVFFGSAAVSYAVLLRRPDLASEIMPSGMIDRVENAAVRSQQGKGYVDIPVPYRPVAASGIIANNVQVTYAVFAFGITAGLGTLAILLFNGIAIGGFAGLYASTGYGTQLLAFVAPHGVLELSAITIGAGAGFHLAAAILVPGALTRREALVARGRRAITLIACATMMLIVAGVLEGNISPRVWPLEWKLFVAGATAVLFAGYLSLGRGAEPDLEPEAFAYSEARALISR